jgi:hypothetical protein
MYQPTGELKSFSKFVATLLRVQINAGNYDKVIPLTWLVVFKVLEDK